MPNTANYHALSVDGICRFFSVRPEFGLSDSDVIERRAIFGKNSLSKATTKPPIEILFNQFKSLLTALLAGAAGLSFLFDEHAEAVAIIVVMTINVMIGFWAESKAVKSMAALRKIGRSTAKVRREGRIVIVPAEDLVPGDILLLEAGDIVTADARLLESAKLQCNESLLTGESAPVDKSTHVLTRQTPPEQREAMVFKGTAITRGHCTGLAVATGENTELGEIVTLSDTATGTVPPLEQRLQKLSEQLLLAVILLMLFLTMAGIIAGRDVLLMVKTGIALAVAAIPEGLPIVATLALARGMWKLAERNALIERLSAVETLGSVNVIFTDKTGTITENNMTAVSLIPTDFPDQNGLKRKGEVTSRALRVCALCYSGNDFDHLNDPMERALIDAAKASMLDPKTCETLFPRINEESFDPEVRMMATIHEAVEKHFYAVKGAPEAVIHAAAYIAGTEKDLPFRQDIKTVWLNRLNQLASKGLRVLALAEKSVSAPNEPPFEGLTFLGLISLEDPPRADAAAAIKAAHDAGVRVVMVTGDNAVTAKNIAAAVGLADNSDIVPIEGHKLSALKSMPEKDKEQLLVTPVFSRMSPRQKLNLIELYQNNDMVVAMTGDGVNDAPALKKADVGIAMGMRGTEVAKEAAEMILKDDAISSIVIAIQQGRIIFANIRKFVIYLLSCNLSEVMVVTFCILAGLPLPLLPLQILFLNLVTDVFPALALGFGKGDSEILYRPPRPKSEGLLQQRHWNAIVSYSAIMTATVVAAFIWALSQPDQSPEYAGTVAFMTLALGQLWHVFNMRSRKAAFLNNQVVRNPFVWGALAVCLTLLTCALYWEPLAHVLRIVPLDRSGWTVTLMASMLPLIVGQVGKTIPRFRT